MGDSSDGTEPYGAIKIEIARGPGAIRKRAKMFIGNPDNGVGLHNMICAVVEAELDEALAGFATAIGVTLNADGSATVGDDGRGIPISAVEATMTGDYHDGLQVLFGACSPDASSSGGWHQSLRSVGVSIVCALSSTLEITNWRNDEEHFMRFRDGVAEAPPKIVGPAQGRHGTEIRFWPSLDVFRNLTAFDPEMLEDRLRRLAIRRLGMRVLLKDDRQAGTQTLEIRYDGRGQVHYLDRFRGARPA